jgi:hypothetical protein
MQKLVGTLFAEAHKAGILEPLVDPAERAALLPESAKNLPKDKQDAAIEARLKENEDFVKLLMKPGADGKPLLDEGRRARAADADGHGGATSSSSSSARR